ncbi:MAG: MarR family transcriptional regulator [Bdellovibrionia bacterium]
MVPEDLPKNILDFIKDRIDSVEQLSVLLLLYTKPEILWTTSEIAKELRSTVPSITKRLNDLYTRGVLVRMHETKDIHKFKPSSADIEELVASLATQNRIRPYKVVDSIYSQPTTILQQFADAFKLRGGKS